MIGLFDIQTEIDKDKLEYIKENWQGAEYCEQCYAKHSRQMPYAYKDLIYKDKDELVEIAHAATYYIYLNRDMATGNTEIDDGALVALLNRDINFAFDESTKTLTKQGQGLGFLNAFIKEKLLSVTVANKGPRTVTDRMQDMKYLYKVVRKAMAMKTDLTITRLFSTAKIVDGQSVSNFRPMASAYLMHKYGIWANPDKDVLNFWIPSEGWLGRLLSSYYTAYKNPDKQINYISTDPSGDVVSSFWEVVEYLSNFGGIHKVKNWSADIRQHGSDVPEADFYKNEGKKFELIWTSPPYSLGFEKYKDSYIIKAIDESGNEVEITDSKGNYLSEELVLDCGKKVKRLRSGDDFTYNGHKYRLVSKRNLGQSHSKASSNYGWNEVFFRPTVKNAKSNLADGGTMIWNVCDVRTHQTLEADVVRICQEEGFTLKDTLKYELSRVPGGILQADGTRKSLRELKKPFEPVFIFNL